MQAAVVKHRHGDGGAAQAQKEAAKEAQRAAAVNRLRGEVNDANRQARLTAAKENTPLIHGWAVKVDKDGKPSKVQQTWPNPSYRK
jgi:hypothetical protein